MPIRFSCACGKGFRAPDSAVGKRVRCPKCGAVVTVPEPKADPDADDRAPDLAPEPETTRLASSPAKPVAVSAYQKEPSKRSSTNLLQYAYWLLLLTFVPLAISLLHGAKEDTLDRLVRSLEKSLPPEPEKASPKQKRAGKEKKAVPVVREEPDLPEGSLDDLIARLPGGRIEGALLPRNSFMHWIFALLAGGVFLALTFLFFPGAAQPHHLLTIAVFTATIGIVLLLVAQLLAGWTQGHIVISGNIVILLLFWIAWAIGFSYRAALDPAVGLAASFLGFTFGVGFCEEVCKALPILWYYRVKGVLPWRTACVWGFASGAGFGVSEGITYSADFYNGIASGDTYLVRFISCVALHGIWTASAALFIHRFRHLLQAEFVWYEFIPRALFFVSIPMILHGLYDTFLKKDMDLLALAAALASFAWLAWSLESARRSEEAPQRVLQRA
ncbi:MAG TPA: hypothetical protein VKU02_03915 [Gemmataceae bacterium]|nr:hypothetical protein [Gemmataceae bacterium]